MEVIINGKIKLFKGERTLKNLLCEVCPKNKHLITEVNETIVKSADWEKTFIREGDQIELVTFVGGG